MMETLASESSYMVPASKDSGVVERIDDVDVSQEMRDSFLEYAYSVIYSRALPDARDGLKPVQRRILYMMSEMGLRPDRGHVKSARVVGEVMGKLHPHGDASIYDALVRLAQDFSLRLPLVDGHGNFGSLDDGPAAARYTEARLAAAALAMTAHLDEGVVDFVPNYDNQFEQPDVLPAGYPNLLVNGGSGIAVGMATNMAPHNLIEVIDASIHLLQNPEASLDELMEFVPGPDLPTGGIIYGLSGIREAYETGKGSFRVRAKASIGNVTARKEGITITELPYLIGPEKVIEKIKDGVTSKKLSGISNIVDLTDRHQGLKLVIEIKTGFDPAAVLDQLYRYTPLEDSFSINNVALVEGRPRTLGLRDMLQVYVDHRKNVVSRRSAFRLNKRQERLHLVQGLLIAIADIDEVIQLIRQSDDSEQARTRLIDVFDLSVPQADYILELRLRRLTKFSRIELESEAETLQAEIDELTAILANDTRLVDVVVSELREVSEQLGTERRTILSSDEGPLVRPAARQVTTEKTLQLQDSPCEVVFTASGRLIRVDLSEEHPHVSVPAKRVKHDAIRSQVRTTRRGTLGAITSHGRLVHFSPVALPGVEAKNVSTATALLANDYIELEPKEKVIAVVSLDQPQTYAMATAEGVVKRIESSSFPAKSGNSIIGLKEDDTLVGWNESSDDSWIIFITSDAQLLRMSASAVRPQGASAGGMAGINLADNAQVIFFGCTLASELDHSRVVTISSSSERLAGADAGRVKVTALAEFPAKGRATSGVRAQSLLKGEDGLGLAWAGVGIPLANKADGGMCALPEELSKRDASGVLLDADVRFLGSQLTTGD